MGGQLLFFGPALQLQSDAGSSNNNNNKLQHRGLHNNNKNNHRNRTEIDRRPIEMNSSRDVARERAGRRVWERERCIAVRVCLSICVCVCVCTVGQVKVCLPICRLDSARQLSQTVAAGSCRPICRCCGRVNPLPPLSHSLPLIHKTHFPPSLSLSLLPACNVALSSQLLCHHNIINAFPLLSLLLLLLLLLLLAPLPPACLTSPTPVALHAALPWPPCAADLK